MKNLFQTLDILMHKGTAGINQYDQLCFMQNFSSSQHSKELCSLIAATALSLKCNRPLRGSLEQRFCAKHLQGNGKKE